MLAKADHVMLVGKGRIVPEGQDDLPDGGWVCNALRRRVPQLLDPPRQLDGDGHPRAAQRQDLLVHGRGGHRRRPRVALSPTRSAPLRTPESPTGPILMQIPRTSRWR